MNPKYELVNKEIIDITSRPVSFNKQTYELVLRNSEDDIRLNLLDSIEWKCGFNLKIMDHLVLTTYMGAGDYAYDVFKHKDNLEITMNISRDGELYRSRTYKAILINMQNNTSGVNTNLSRSDLNKTGMNRITFQLVEQEIEVIRTLKVSGIYKQTDVKSLLVSAFQDTISSVKIRKNKINPVLNIVTPDNTKFYDHIMIPTGTKLIDLPTFLHDTNYGIYKGDIGVYFKILPSGNNNILNAFIYPLYSREPSKDKRKELTIYYAPTQFAKFNKSNYTFNSDGLRLVASTLDIVEIKDNVLMSQGGAITSTDPDSFLMYGDKINGDKIDYDKDKVLNNLTYQTKDGLVNERYVGNEPNLYKHVSKVLSDSMDLVKISWKFSDHTLLIPGMFTKLYYQVGNDVKVMQGILQEYYTLYNEAGKIEETIMMFKLGEVK